MDYLIRVYENKPGGRLLMVLDDVMHRDILDGFKRQDVRMVKEYYKPLSKIKFDRKYE